MEIYNELSSKAREVLEKVYIGNRRGEIIKVYESIMYDNLGSLQESCECLLIVTKTDDIYNYWLYYATNNDKYIDNEMGECSEIITSKVLVNLSKPVSDGSLGYLKLIPILAIKSEMFLKKNPYAPLIYIQTGTNGYSNIYELVSNLDYTYNDEKYTHDDIKSIIHYYEN
jgi:hypothetical protein